MKYWDINRVLKKQKLINIITGERTVGKSYGVKKFVLENYYREQAQFVYIRRFKDELRTAKDYFNDINRDMLFSDAVYYKDGYFWMDKEIVGYRQSLTSASLNKGSAFSRVTDIIFEEFMIEDSKHYYLPNEVEAFLSIYETINRTAYRESEGIPHTRAWLLGNIVTISNPYFLYYDLQVPHKTDVMTNGQVLLQVIGGSDVSDTFNKSPVADLYRDQNYKSYVTGESFLRDKSTFVEKKTGKQLHMFNVIFKGQKFGIWNSVDTGIYFVSNDTVEENITFPITLDDHKPNLYLLKVSQNMHLQKFLKAFQNGNVRFESVRLQTVGMQMCKYINLI